MNNDSNYTQKDIIDALRAVGVSKGENIFIHSNIGYLGKLHEGETRESYYRIFKEAVFDVIGPQGTLIVPAFTYSFCWGKEFNRDKTPGLCGFFSEALRKDAGALRSDDANFSIAAIGEQAQYFTNDAPSFSFGPNSFWERFYKSKGKFFNINFDAGSTFVHYVERAIGVPYRYDKAFTGTAIEGITKVQKTFYHFVHDLNKPQDVSNFAKFHKKALDLELVKVENLGKGQVVLISACHTMDLIKEEITGDPYFLREGSHVGEKIY